MKLAFKQARKIKGNTGLNPAVGCVIVKDKVVISLSNTGFNGTPHAERKALSSKKINYKNSTLYSTLEPCTHIGKTLPCTDIIIKKKIKKVYFSIYDPDYRSYQKAKKILSKNNIYTYSNISNLYGANFYKDFYINKKDSGIFISSKLATSKDFFIKNKKKKWITNVYSRKRAHLLRSISEGIMTTSKTILNDNSILNCRIDGLEKYSPKRFILDKDLKIPLTKKIIKTAKKIKTYIFYNKLNIAKIKKLKSLNINTVKINIKNGFLDFDQIISFLKKINIKNILVEAGLEFNNFLLNKKYINVFYHFISNEVFKNKGIHNSKSFFDRMNKFKRIKKKISVNLFDDNLVKYYIK